MKDSELTKLIEDYNEETRTYEVEEAIDGMESGADEKLHRREIISAVQAVESITLQISVSSTLCSRHSRVLQKIAKNTVYLQS